MPKYGAVVTDASPLISLEKIPDGFSLLQHTCSKLLVPEAVAKEVSYFLRDDEDYFSKHEIGRFVGVEVVPNTEIPRQESLRRLRELGPGEKFALQLAKDRAAPLVVEERKARRLAREQGLQVFGAAAIVKIARDQGGIDHRRATEALLSLFETSRINQKVLQRMLRALKK